MIWHTPMSQKLCISILINPLLLLFKALLQGQKDCVFFSRHLIYKLQQEHFIKIIFQGFWVHTLMKCAAHILDAVGNFDNE
jgi:hypothetical protein